MNLIEYDGEKVVIRTKRNNIFKGIIGDYIYPEDDDTNRECIVIDDPHYNNPIGLYKDDIKSIEIIK
ncbi:hypothetical protein [Aerococcus vaginalis]